MVSCSGINYPFLLSMGALCRKIASDLTSAHPYIEHNYIDLLMVNHILSFPVSEMSDVVIHLVDYNSNHTGIIELGVKGEWGMICTNHWTNEDARVACRQLGYSDGKYKSPSCIMVT